MQFILETWLNDETIIDIHSALRSQSTNVLVTPVLIRHSWGDGNTQQTDRDEDMACIAKFLMLIFVKVLPASVANWDPSRMSKCQLTHDGKVLIYGDTSFKCAHAHHV
jgi:hypothetical protein